MRLTTKLAGLVATIILVSMMTFLLTLLIGGDPVVSVLGSAYDTSSEQGRAQIAVVRDELNLDRPVPVRYALWAKGVLTGDLGKSYGATSGGLTTNRLLKERLPVTLEIMVLTQLTAIALAIPLGTLAAYKQGRWLDKLISTTGFGLLSLPNFALGLILVFFFSIKLKWFPSGGYTRLTENLGDNLRSMVIPVMTLALGLAAVYVRLLRAEMSATLQEDFILTATSKGIKPWRVLLRHALRPSSFSLLTIIAINVGSLVGGAVVMEYFMAIPGVGSALVENIFKREYEVVLGIVLVITIFYVVANFIVDLLYSILDPRIRRGSTRA